MAEVSFEQHNVQAVFVVVADDGSEFRDALIMPQDEFVALSSAELNALALDRYDAHVSAVSAAAAVVEPDVVALSE